jgi:hypothetical protein
MNLDSFSLYTRAGFVPRCAYQDLLLRVPDAGMAALAPPPPTVERVRPATPADIDAIAGLEMDLTHIRRAKDYRYFVENRDSIWHVSVLEAPTGGLDGILASVAHPGSTMLGPGVARTPQDAAGLLYAELDHRRGLAPVFLIPVDAPALVQQVYAWGARNCELHFHQVRGPFIPFAGINLATFMPETG